jgi:hypothetical protein
MGLLLLRRGWAFYAGAGALAVASWLLLRQESFQSLQDGVKVALLLFLSFLALAAGSGYPAGTWVLPLAVFSGFGFLSLEPWRAFLGLVPMALGCLALGGLLRKMVKLPNPEETAKENHLDHWLVDSALGSALFSLLGLGLGLVGLARGPLLLVCTLAILALGFRQWWDRIAGLRAWALSPSAPSRPLNFMGGVALALWLGFFFATLGPEMGSDALGGRVAMPVRIATSGSFSAMPALGAVNLGWAGGELFHLWLLPWVGTSAARLWAWWVMGLLGLWALGRSRKQGWAWVGWLGVFASSQAWWQAFSGLVDMHQGLLTAGAVLLLAQDGLSLSPQKVGLAMFLAGSATAVKMNSLAVVLALGLAVLFKAFQGPKKTLWARLRPLLGAGAFGLFAAVGPWACRSLWLTGNPTFPFLNQLFRSPLGKLQVGRKIFGPGDSIGDWLLVPWTLFFSPEKYSEVGAFNPALLFLCLVGIFLAKGPKPRASRIFLWTSALWFLLWAITEPNSRYLLPGMLPLVGAFAFSQNQQGSFSRFLLWGGFLLSILGFFSTLASPFFWPARAIRGPLFPHLRTQEQILASIPSLQPCRYLNQKYGQNYKVWQANMRDFLYCEGEVYVTTQGDQRLAPFFAQWLVGKGARPEEMAEKLQEWGFSHVMYRLDLPREWRYRGRPRSVMSREMESCCLEPEFSWNNLRVFRLVEPGRVGGQWVPCAFGNVRPNGPGRLLFHGPLPGGELVRWRFSGSLEEGGRAELTFSLRDEGGKLLHWFKEVWTPQDFPGPWELWQTVPAGGGLAWVDGEVAKGSLEELSCELWQVKEEAKGE